MSNNDHPLSVGLVSLGCAKNLVDTQVMCGVLLTEDLTLAPNPDECDAVLINTCAFIASAREEADSEILRACDLKKQGAIGAIIVAGCLPQRYGERLVEKYPDVDAWIGVDQLEEIADIVRETAAEGSRRRKAIVHVSASPVEIFEPRVPALTITGGPFAYLKISEGCNHACAYCAIPGIRGRLRSRKVSAILDEAAELLDNGIRELNIVAQDATAYGRDKRGAPRLPALLKKLDGFDGNYWLRILYGYPSLVDDAMLEAFATTRHLARYIDIPIQHSHPDVLRAMLRADTIPSVVGLPGRLREACPGIAIRTTCLVGFPGETEAHFQHLLDFVKEARFDDLGVFVFSPEEGTVAASLPDQVPLEVAEDRRDRLMRLQKRLVSRTNKERIGSKVKALLLRPLRGGRWEARSEWQAPDVDGVTIVSGMGPRATPGAFANVRITGVRGYDSQAEKI